jgi:hypothetical protein
MQIGSLMLENTIIAANSDLSASANHPDISIAVPDTVSSNGFNWIGDNSGATTYFPAGTPNGEEDNVGSSESPLDPMLEDSGDYGGPTLTMPPMVNSPLIDQGNCPGETADQRGRSNTKTDLRVIDLDPDNAADGCDPGAVERSVSFSVGGTVSGLAGTGLVLQNHGGDDLDIIANGDFVFTTPIAEGSTYNVSVKTQPSSPGQFCTVNNGSGTLNSGDVSDVSVSCTTLENIIYQNGFENGDS